MATIPATRSVTSPAASVDSPKPSATATSNGKAKRKKAPIDPNETASQRFARLANVRGKKALKALANMEKLHGKGYESTPVQQAAIVQRLTDAVAKVKASFAATEAKGEPENLV